MNPKEKRISFLYNGEAITTQCKIDENIFKIFSNIINKDLENMAFLYNGNIIKEDFDLENIKDYEIKIIIVDFEFEREQKESLKQSKEIICPICNELCEIDINKYKISIKIALISIVFLI